MSTCPAHRFEPTAITPGRTTVTWTNRDVFTQNVQLLDDGGAVLTMRPGESVGHTFADVGTHRDNCSLHAEDMQGTVVVTGR